MSATRTFSAIATSGFSIARQNLRLTSVHGIAQTGNSNSVLFIGLYTTTIASASTSVLGTATAPASNAVPVWQMAITGKTTTNDFIEALSGGYPEIPGPIYFAVSSADGKYTATTDTVDIFLEMEEWEIEEGPTLSSATLSSGNSLTVWTDTIAAPSAAKAVYDILALDLGNSSGAQLYLQLFAENPTTNPAPVPWRTWEIPIAGSAGVNINLAGAIYLQFGDSEKGGLTPVSQGGTLGSGDNTGTNTSACYLRVSTTPTTLTLAGSSAAMIVARYSTPTV